MSEQPDHTQATSAMMPREVVTRPDGIALRVLDGPRAGEVIAVSKSRLICGRGEGVDISLREKSVSKAHFMIMATDVGIEVQDLNSLNGLWFGRRRLYHGVIVPGDVLTAGECRVEVVGVTTKDVEVTTAKRCGQMLGSCTLMRELFVHIERVAQTSIEVLIEGETGTGKELAARALHELSRTSGPFVALDCASLAPSLANATLFGYRRGAFTGANRNQPGIFELAEGGVLFLDEVGELGLSEQQKLLRVLDQRVVCREGEPGNERPVNFRIVAATNRDLEGEVNAGNFRKDLYYRLSDELITLPPLRERKGDALFLAKHFAEDADVELSEDAQAAIPLHSWPGNVRELFRSVGRGAALCRDGVIQGADLRFGRDRALNRLAGFLRRPASYKELHEELDRVLLPRVMRESGTQKAAAEQLGMSRQTLRAKLQVLGLHSQDEGD